MKNYKLKIKKSAAIFLSAFCLLHSAFAVYLQPFWYYGRDQFGFPITNAITIDSWPPTNSITANSTNLVISVPHTFLPDANGFVSNNIAIGNYRVVVSGFSPGVPFSILSNAAPVNISSTANVPVTTFMNFVLAQIIDAGTIAGRGSNDFVVNLPAAVVTAIGFQPVTNSFTGIITPLGYTPATNTYSGVTNSLGFAPPTNNYTGLTNALGFAPATNSNPGIIFALQFTPATNNFNGITNSLGYKPATNNNAGIVAALLYIPKTNDGNIGLLANSVASIATNGWGMWVVLKTNDVPGPAFTNLFAGSILTTTNGGFYTLSNLVWIAH